MRSGRVSDPHSQSLMKPLLNPTRLERAEMVSISRWMKTVKPHAPRLKSLIRFDRMAVFLTSPISHLPSGWQESPLR